MVERGIWIGAFIFVVFNIVSFNLLFQSYIKTSLFYHLFKQLLHIQNFFHDVKWKGFWIIIPVFLKLCYIIGLLSSTHTRIQKIKCYHLTMLTLTFTHILTYWMMYNSFLREFMNTLYINKCLSLYEFVMYRQIGLYYLTVLQYTVHM